MYIFYIELCYFVLSFNETLLHTNSYVLQCLLHHDILY